MQEAAEIQYFKASELADALDALATGRAKLHEKARAQIPCADVRNGLAGIMGAMSLAIEQLDVGSRMHEAEWLKAAQATLALAREAALALERACEVHEKKQRGGS